MNDALQVTTEQISDIERARNRFNNAFDAWAKDYAPEGDTTALRAISWYWYASGRHWALSDVTTFLAQSSRLIY